MQSFRTKIFTGTLAYLCACFLIAPIIYYTQIKQFGYLYLLNYISFAAFITWAVIGTETTREGTGLVKIVMWISYIFFGVFVGYVIGTSSAMMFGLPH